MGNQLLPVPLPLKGLNTINPHVAWDSGYAREFTNYSLYNGRPKVRPAIRSYAVSFNATLVAAGGVVWFDPANTDYFIAASGDIGRISTNSFSASIGGTPSYPATRCKHVSLDLVVGLREPRNAAQPFGAWSFTTLSITATSIKTACSHKGRLYVADDSTIEYSELQAVSGTMAGSFPLASGPVGLLEGQKILRIFSVTVNPSVSTENVLVVFGEKGKVLVYAGDYPGSASWQIIGNFNMPPPGNAVTFAEVDGDIFVGTELYAYWFRELFAGGAQSAYANSPSAPIENFWQSLLWGVTYGSHGYCFYEPVLDAIICTDTNGTTTPYGTWGKYNSGSVAFGYLVYFRKYGAWAAWIGSPLVWPVQRLTSAPTEVYGGGYNNPEIKKLTHGNVVDQYSNTSTTTDFSIETSWKTPYYYGKVGTKLNGVRLFFENTVSGYLEKLRAIFDYSDYNSSYGWYTQSTATTINPGNYVDGAADLTANTWNQYSPFIGIGGQGGTFSLQFTQKPKSGSSATQTQNIYAAVAHIEPAGELF